MANQRYYLSFCIPVYNEERIIHAKIMETEKGLQKILKDKSFEILVIENGSTDKTLKELEKIKTKNVRVIKLKDKGHGLAMKTAIINAKAEFVLLTAIDLPFGFSDLKAMLKVADKYDIIFGSKAHPDSVVISPPIRRLASNIYRFFLRLLFNIKIGDTQGTIFLKRAGVLSLLKDCDANNAFFAAQLAIFAEKKKLSMIEVPVINEKVILRRSKYNVFSNGGEMFMTMLDTYLKTKSIYIK
jgi:glycosyltransferase involved in cell wall biosynthesis